MVNDIGFGGIGGIGRTFFFVFFTSFGLGLLSITILMIYNVSQSEWFFCAVSLIVLVAVPLALCLIVAFL
jgi:hypothetical protein